MTVPRLPTGPVTLQEVDRSSRAVLTNLGQLFRYDLSAPYQHLPDDDGTFNNRHLDRFLLGDGRAWLVHVDGRLAGFATIRDHEAGGHAITQFWVTHALRRTGVGLRAALLVLAQEPGEWHIAFQVFNPGAEPFWQRVAEEAVGEAWRWYDSEPTDGRPPDRWITFTTDSGP